MPSQLTQRSIVLTAQNINVPIFQSHWLVKHEVIQAEEIHQQSAFTELATQVVSKEFHLLVVPDRLQLSLAPSTTGGQSLATRILGKILNLLPHTPFQAVGRNFQFHVFPPENVSLAEASRSAFRAPAIDSLRMDESNARYGAYFSFAALEARVRVDVKPASVRAKSEGPAREFVLANINAHSNVADDRDAIFRVIDGFADMENLARQIADGFASALEPITAEQ